MLMSPKLKNILDDSIIKLPTPSTISYLWNFGSILGVCLLIQILTGLFISFHYSADINLSFNMVSHISRDVNYGWLLRFCHANGASMFFIFIYLHVGRGLYYSSFHFWKVWVSGTLIILTLMGTAFIGYVLPWGQMSFWGATVITNLLSAIPYIGESLTLWIWGGFSIGNATLTRFFSLHFILPFILAGLVIGHIILLHEKGSSNPVGISLNIDKIPFHPFFTIKDLFGFILFFLFFSYITLLKPFLFSDPENFIPANPMITPIHIQPEWYFLFAYCILRSIPNKLGGVIGLLFSIIIILSLPLTMKNKFSSMMMYPLNKLLFWCLINSFLLLSYLGSCVIEPPFVNLSLMTTLFYFSYFIFTPLISK